MPALPDGRLIGLFLGRIPQVDHLHTNVDEVVDIARSQLSVPISTNRCGLGVGHGDRPISAFAGGDDLCIVIDTAP